MKLFIPITAATLTMALILLFISRNYFEKNYQDTVNERIKTVNTEIDRNITRISKKAMFAATICSNMKLVKDIYSSYHADQKFDSCSALLKTEFVSIQNSLAKEIGFTPKIHFHLPPAQSFMRTWTDKRGDDLSSFRKTVLEVCQTGKPVYGIEAGRGGFVVRGIAPINVNGSTLGSVEVYFPISQIGKQIVSHDNEAFAIYMHKDLLKLATLFAKEIKTSKIPQTGDFYEFYKTENKFNKDEINVLMLDKGFKKTTILEKDTLIYSVFPLKNYNGSHEGVGIYRLNMSETSKTLTDINKYMLITVIALMVIMAVLIFIVIRLSITKPVNEIVNVIKEMALGKPVKDLKIKNQDEISSIKVSLNSLNKGLVKTSEFAKSIGEGNTNIEFKPLSEEDSLGNALLEMRDSLDKAKEEEAKRKIEDDRRNWATAGIAKFGDILRQRSDDVNEFAYEIIKNLVDYVDANQGGMYLLNDDSENTDEHYLELAAAYAYERRKYVDQKIQVGDGIIGACAYEKLTVYMTDIPENYINIKSGLGGANPSSLLLIPLKIEEDVFGVIEIASFKAFEKFEIDFLEKVAESIASTIQGVKINLRTDQLLKQAQEQSEVMQQQEEEMRQNMEEMRATQEQMEQKEAALLQKDEEQKAEIERLNEENEGKLMQVQFVQQEVERQRKELEHYLKGIDYSYITYEMRPDLTIIAGNDKMQEVTGIDSGNLIGKKLTDLMSEEKAESAAFKDIWDKLQNGEIHAGAHQYFVGDREIWLYESFIPIIDASGSIDKIFVIANDITALHDKEKHLEYLENRNGQYLNAINHTYGIVHLDTDGNIVSAGEKYAEYTTLPVKELKGKSLKSFIPEAEFKADEYEKMWKGVLSGNQHEGVFRYDFNGNKKWFYETYTSIKDSSGNISEVFVIVNDITNIKEK